jgi:hypothetical protein
MRVLPVFPILEERSVYCFWNQQTGGRRVFLGTFFACIAYSYISQAVFAQTHVSAHVDWYGIYSISSRPEPNDPSGKRYISTPVAAETTDKIPGKEGVRFGFSYTLSGEKGAKVTVKHVYRFPAGGMRDKVFGSSRSALEQTREDVVAEPVLIGWSFVGAPPENIIIGEWSLEVWQGDQKLVEKKFTVYSP